MPSPSPRIPSPPSPLPPTLHTRPGEGRLHPPPLFKFLVVSVTSLIFATGAGAGVGAWTAAGPDGGPIQALAIDGTTPATLYAGTLGGVFESTDSAATWSACNDGLSDTEVQALAVDTGTVPSTVYAGTLSGGIFKTDDCSGDWTAANSGLDDLDVRDLALVSTTTLYAATAGGVFKSTNSGVLWTLVLNQPEVTAVAFDPTTTSTVYAGTGGGGVFKSMNSGGMWAASNSGLANLDVRDLATNPSGTVYAGTAGGGVFKSINSGGSWLASNTSLTNLDIRAVAIDPVTPATLYAGTAGGVFSSANSAGTWAAVSTGLANTDVMALAIDPATPATLYAGTAGGVFGTANSGTLWSAMSSGLAATDARVVVIDPTTSTTLYAGTTAGGVFESIDGATTWTAKNSGLTTTDVRALVIDPTTTTTLYAGTFFGGVFKFTMVAGSWSAANSGLGSLDVRALAAASTTTLYAGTAGGVYKSIDSGGSWTVMNSSLDNVDVRALAIDPLTSTTVYAGTDGGVFKSINGGTSWTAMSSGLVFTDVRSLAIDPTTTTTLYAGTESGGVFRSDDGGASWVAKSQGLTDPQIKTLAVDAVDPTRLYAGTKTAGVFKTGNQGELWVQDIGGLTSLDVFGLAVDPGDPLTVYAATGGGGVFEVTQTESELCIEKVAAEAEAIPDSTVTYTLTVVNAPGSAAALGVVVNDLFPDELTGVTWTCASTGATCGAITATTGGTCGSAMGSGNILETVDLPADSAVVFTATGTVALTATGSLTNQALVASPSGVSDPNVDNNSSTVFLIVDPTTDLGITKDDGLIVAVPGEMVTYTLVVSNGGPLDVVGATVEDSFPAELTGCSWGCVPTGAASCDAGSVAGDIDDTVDLPVGETLTYTATCTVDPAATGTLENTASVSPPLGTSDDATANDSATDSDTVLTPEADLSITKDDGQPSAVAGEMVTYILTVDNAGPSDAVDATVTDDFPEELSCTTTCVASGGASCSVVAIVGDVSDTVSIPAGDSVTYTAECTIDSEATVSVSNTAAVEVAAGTTDTVAGNNSDPDTDTLTAEADLEISKDDGLTAAAPGDTVTYTIEVTNAGPSGVFGATVEDLFPAEIDSCTWTCEAAGGALCAGAGIQALAFKPSNSAVIYAGTDAGMFRSLAGSSVWTESNAGLGNLDVRSVAADPGVASTTVYAGTAGGVFQSIDGASSWVDVTTVDLTNTLVQALAVNPDTTDLVYAGTAGGVFQYDDVTETWTDVTTAGLTNTDVRSLAFDPTDSDTVYAGTAGGVFRYEDVGGTWTDVTTAGLTNTDVRSLAVDPTDAMILYAGTAGGVFRTPDAGVSWSAVNSGLTDLDVRVVAVDVDTPTTLYAATAGGVFKSTDSGATWLSVSFDLTSLDVGALAVDPNDPAVLYAGTGAGAFVSEDAAASWVQATSGLDVETTGDLVDTVDLPALATATYTAACTILSSATGTVDNTATVTVPIGVTELDGSDNSATDSDILDLEADLSVDKDDGQTSAVPGETVIYTITVANAGPSDATDVTVTDTFPAALSGCSWTCAADAGATCAGAGSGDIDDSTVVLLAGTSVVYTVTCTILSTATGTLDNTATVAAVGVTDPDAVNDSATDSDFLTPEADLSITKDDGATTAAPGGTVIYTITAANAGPSAVIGATVTDLFPDDLTCTWTCAPSGGATCTGGGGDIADSVDLPVGGAAVYTATCDVDQAATGSLDNTATVAPPAGAADPVPGNDSATDVDTLGPSADLVVTKDDGETTVIPGQTVTYTITVTNAGPSTALATTVTDVFPAELEGITWTCVGSGGGSCTAAGAGDIAESVDLPVGASVTFTASGTVAAGALGDLINTASAAPAAGIADPEPLNSIATDTDAILVEADLAITKDDGQEAAEAGAPVTYIITVTNNGPQQVTDAVVADLFPAELLAVSWTCFAGGGSSCTPGPIAGDIDDLAFLPAGASVIYTATGTLDSGAAGTLENTATVTAPAGVTDPVSGNNSATDIDSLDPQADLVMAVDAPAEAVLGHPLTFTVAASNDGVDDVTGAMVISDFAADLNDVTWTCIASPGAACEAAGAGALSEAVDLEAGASVTFTVTGDVDVAAAAALVNGASVLPPGSVLDPDSGNNSDSASTDPVPGADLEITKDDGQIATTAGATLSYTIEVTNNGFFDVDGAEVADVFPLELSGCAWTCAAVDAVCGAAAGSGDIAETVDLDVDGSVTFTVTCTVTADAEEIVNTATVALPAGLTDPLPENDSATDETVVAIFTDGFESGDVSAWSTSVGLAAFEIELLEQPADRLAMRFLIDGETLSGLRSGPAWILVGTTERGDTAFLLELRRGAAGVEQRASVRLDDGDWRRSAWVRWEAAAAALDLDWSAAWSAEVADGALLLSLDGELLIWLTELDNGLQRLRSLDYYAVGGRPVLRPEAQSVPEE